MVKRCSCVASCGKGYLEEAAQACGVSARTTHKWLDRFGRGGAGLVDHSARPERCPHPMPAWW
ncbi:leucine zipper domain-containing protein [Xanthomonas oryzae]|uniref:leucine zipper domain-containing protein n=1 Tax=Xanthomonas oryzae TaxID=347 RepID=UPI0009EB0FFD|nr:hypothetical protein EYC54_17775 [Xanthomonas oryzae]QBG91067.1 hypothetical protein EYR26_04800 [Xanthomonas oryzae]QBG96879.1 hypothetical protein EYC55_17775 [Xanthomonas oryzae]QBG99010.1 hypothetical protein EYC56_05815 [Xanthomonas oryzae]QBH04724.1 hypothetical protein EYC57_16970 [Xanthomonas oryzae]